ncbi:MULTISPECIES: pantetheine-phosphate adenylyltransferase [unclassified Pseudodesulfovibrio]|uniref:pantetheine-phosphate adenylyltransferase n=1 Tax=unclassified Pseudodesulfovibrio TaxID=2661612 RepID=UPI000FEBB55D|nr:MULTISPECIES: pantetheine-phosphate adenylyltransferase [unclassified Pseudodesulfovibrio]MCJ2163693.1 pantetheine-phosphate adenylyltransferase [Pseudodesulfovibrio sp. S3-i]RWU06050.1 pantetheine-phosphate adenylyltransferase [Pseudodesulfovibrio sp. S3]
MAKLNPRLAVYPGTFDPLTMGHVGLTRRGLSVFDNIILAIAESTPKKTLFSIEERVSLAKEVFRDEPRVTVEPFDCLLIDYVQSRNAGSIMRGLRAVSDFEYEFQMALMNRKLERSIETVFMMTDFKWMYLSSTIVKEVAQYGGDVRGLVPGPVVNALAVKYGYNPESGNKREKHK